MPRKSFDFFSKAWMEELLSDFGEVKIERPVASEVRTIDLVFYPNRDRISDLESLGLLGRMLAKPCPVEFFRNAVPTQEITNCRGKTEAVKELLALPEDYPYREETQRHLSRLQVNLEMRQNKNADLREVIMNLAPAYDEWYAKTIEEGKQKGKQEVIMNLAPAYEEWYAKTIEEGKQKGEQLGIVKGKMLGITEGKQVQSIQTARRMLGRNMSLEEIAELTDLPLARIQALQAEN